MSLYVCDGCGVAVTHSLPHALIFERSHNGVTRGQRLELCVRCADHAEREIRGGTRRGTAGGGMSAPECESLIAARWRKPA